MAERLTWQELEDIAVHFKQKRNEHQNTVKQYVDIIQECSDVCFYINDSGVYLTLTAYLFLFVYGMHNVRKYEKIT